MVVINILNIKEILDKVHPKDCIEFMKTLPDKCINLIIADPPYNQVVDKKWDNQWKTEQEYLDWCIEWIKECSRILTDNGSIYIWGGMGDKTINFAKLICAIEYNITTLTRKNVITVKRNKGRGSNKNYMPCREELIWLVKNPKDFVFNKPYTSELKKKYGYKNNKDKPDYKVAGNIWTDITFPWWGSKDEPYINACQKPLKACDRIIQTSSNERDLVYIPFAGSGSEIISCMNNNRLWVATELEENSINNIITPRINKLNNKTN
jgi:DNA modification methylase